MNLYINFYGETPGIVCDSFEGLSRVMSDPESVRILNIEVKPENLRKLTSHEIEMAKKIHDEYWENLKCKA